MENACTLLPRLLSSGGRLKEDSRILLALFSMIKRSFKYIFEKMEDALIRRIKRTAI
jgi:hypothetical protein